MSTDENYLLIYLKIDMACYRNILISRHQNLDIPIYENIETLKANCCHIEKSI